MRPAAVRLLLGRIDQHDVDAGNRGDVGNARAHHAGAEYADAGHVAPLDPARAPRQFVELALVHEQRAGEVARHGAGQQLSEVLRLDAQRKVKRQVATLIEGAEDGTRRRIVASDGLGDERRSDRKRLVDRGQRQAGATRTPKALGVPGCRGGRVGEYPGAGPRHEFGGRRDLVHESRLQCLGRPELRAVGDELGGCRQTDKP